MINDALLKCQVQRYGVARQALQAPAVYVVAGQQQIPQSIGEAQLRRKLEQWIEQIQSHAIFDS